MLRGPMSYRSTSAIAVALAGLMLLTTAAAGKTDTTPPKLVALSVSPARIDITSGGQDVRVTATITDDLSGFAYGYVSLYSPSGHQHVGGDLQSITGDEYATTLNFAQGAEPGVWAYWSLDLQDADHNHWLVEERKMISLGINAAVGVGSFDASNSRSFARLQLYPPAAPNAARGHLVRDTTSPCSSHIPLVLQRQVENRWRLIGRTYSEWGVYDFAWKRKTPGTYRLIAPVFPIGTPTLTTCLRAFTTASSTKVFTG